MANGPPSDKSVMRYFTSHYDYFLELKEMCKAFPNIKGIDDDGTAYHESDKAGREHVGSWTAEELAAKDKMLRLLNRLGMESMSCAYSTDTSPRIKGAEFVVDTWGIYVSGGASVIDYYENCKPLDKIGVPELYSITLPLSKPCWFLYRSW